MIKNLVLFTGEDDYRLFQRLNLFKKKFAEKYADGEIEVLEKSNSYNDLEVAVFTPNLFGGKRLIICQDFWDTDKFETAVKQDFFTKLPEYKDECSVFVIATKLDKRLKSAKFLLENAQLEIFDKLPENDLIRWIEKFTTNQGGQISHTDSKFLLQRCGDDLWNLSNEIKKLVAIENGQISRDLIENCTRANPQLEIWDFLRYLGQKNAKLTIQKFRDLLLSGTSVHQILSMLQREFRINAQILAGLENNISEKELGRILKLHPFAFKKALPVAKKLSLKQVEKFYDILFEIEKKTKTGGFYLTTTDTSELELAIEKLIIAFCQKA